MKIFAIYVIIGIIEWILMNMQVKALKDKEEREKNIKFKSNQTLTSTENCLATIKSVAVMAVPILRTILTIILLFSEEAHEMIIGRLYDLTDVEQK